MVLQVVVAHTWPKPTTLTTTKQHQQKQQFKPFLNSALRNSLSSILFVNQLFYHYKPFSISFLQENESKLIEVGK